MPHREKDTESKRPLLGPPWERSWERGCMEQARMDRHMLEVGQHGSLPAVHEASWRGKG